MARPRDRHWMGIEKTIPRSYLFKSEISVRIERKLDSTVGRSEHGHWGCLGTIFEYIGPKQEIPIV